jgi:site-specific recombinase XerD
MSTPSALMTAYLASLEARRIPYNTFKAYRADLTRFVALMPSEMEAITVAQIEAYLGAGGVGEATSRRRHACLRSFYQWLIAQEELQVNPMERLKLGKTPEREPRPLRDEVVQQVLSAIPPAHTRDRALFTLLYETGMRVSESVGHPGHRS